MLNSIIIAAITIFMFMNVVYIIAQIKKDNSIIDIAWGLGFIFVAISLLIFNEAYAFDYIVLSSVVFIWGTRLAFHIYCRSKGKGEDFRYKEWREGWGDKAAIKAYFKVFMLQGIIMLFVAYPIIYLSEYYTYYLNIYNIIGLIIFLIGYLFESIGDYQLYKFKKDDNNKGKIITTGLWKYTRHPNYFGEALLWWGIALIAFDGGLSYTVFLGPFIINFFLIKISGIPLLEKKYEGRADWEEYKKKTPAFIPFF